MNAQTPAPLLPLHLFPLDGGRLRWGCSPAPTTPSPIETPCEPPITFFRRGDPCSRLPHLLPLPLPTLVPAKAGTHLPLHPFTTPPLVIPPPSFVIPAKAGTHGGGAAWGLPPIHQLIIPRPPYPACHSEKAPRRRIWWGRDVPLLFLPPSPFLSPPPLFPRKQEPISSPSSPFPSYLFPLDWGRLRWGCSHLPPSPILAED